jgi:hypothetical protein
MARENRMGNLRFLLDARCILVSCGELWKRDLYRPESTP